MFSKKATKIDEIFAIDLTLLHNVKLMVKISSIFVAFLENLNFMKNDREAEKILQSDLMSTRIPNPEFSKQSRN